MNEWIGVDLDGTLADWNCGWPTNHRAIGAPIMPMVERVRQWIAEGKDVRIFTARMDYYHPLGHLTSGQVKAPIKAWCLKHLGKKLPITNRKDHFCRAIYDDRAIQVEHNTGRLIGEAHVSS